MNLEELRKQFKQSPQTVFQKNYPSDVEKQIFAAKELWIVGANLGRTMISYTGPFQEMLRNQAKIKFLIIDPSEPANILATSRTRGKFYNLKTHRLTILRSIAIMAMLREESPAQVDIRTIQYVPSFGYFAADIETSGGVLFLEHYGYKLGDDIPKFVLRPQDEQWYELFKYQLLTLWENADEWKMNFQETEALLLSNTTDN